MRALREVQEVNLFHRDFENQDWSSAPKGGVATEIIQTLNEIQKDVFPYLRLYSISSAIVGINILIYVLTDSSSLTIKPMKSLNDLLPWLLCPLTSQRGGSET